MTPPLPRGFSAHGLSCGIKRDASREDLGLVLADRDCVAAGVYTQNQVVAAPVLLDRERTPADKIRAVIVNSGNANACTGPQGLENARQMARLAAQACGLHDEQVLVLSTGIIGEQLPLEKIARGIEQLVPRLGQDEASLTAVARAMMTTDTRQKLSGRSGKHDAGSYQITGMAKGAAMIGPRMATMLAIVLTDAPLRVRDAQDALVDAVQDSFNCISVEGHMSTNDTVLLLANGALGGAYLSGIELVDFRQSLRDVCAELARAIPDDGEGASHLIEIDVTGCRNREEAHRIARSIADSALVKTAIAGADPNWGRIVSAAGYAGVAFDPATVSLHLNGLALFRAGTPVPFDPAQVSQSIRDHRITRIELNLGQGAAQVRFWTCDLTAEYVHLNADYHT